MVVKRDRAEVFRSLRKTILYSSVVGLVIILISLSVLFIVSTNLSRPILKLSRVAIKVGEGELNIRADENATGEIGILASTFNSMVKQIENWRNDLEAEVVARTKELNKSNVELKKEISERTWVEEELRESEEKFRIISEQSLLGLVIIQNEFIQYANHAFWEITEYPRQDPLTMPVNELLDLIHSEDRTLMKAKLEKNLTTTADEQTHYQFRFAGLEGSEKWLEALLQTIPYNKSPALMVTLIDITKRKTAEERTETQRQQLIRADRLASPGILVAGVAHEINNPNQSILTNADLIIDAWNSVTPILEDYYKLHGDFIIGGLDYMEMREEMPNYLVPDRKPDFFKKICSREMGSHSPKSQH